ncbi:hypothetical protein [Saccharopolyspora hattusasensis]|uniref:hypothetical protein n=1 Tax=Saccharopolyspora hattusasensis TaxID=1128679 RepID=UPI003D96DD5A
MAEEIAAELRAEGVAVTVGHRDVDQPVIQPAHYADPVQSERNGKLIRRGTP